MSLVEFTKVIDRRYRSIVIVLCALAGATWVVVGAVERFTSMVDERALKVVETFSVKPLAEHEEMKRRITQNEKDIAGLLESAKLMDHNLTRLMAIYEEQDRGRRGIPLQLSGPVRP